MGNCTSLEISEWLIEMVRKRKNKIAHKYFPVISGLVIIGLIASIGANLLFKSHAQTPGAPTSASAIDANICGNSTYLQSPYSYAGLAAVTTTVAAGSNGASVTSFTGTQTLDVASTIGFPSGPAAIEIGTNVLFYQGIGSGTLIDVAWFAGSGTISTGQTVIGSNTGSFTSGEYGLPTFGGSGTDFPNATSGVIIPAGPYDPYDGGPFNKGNTVYYFEPGVHVSGARGMAPSGAYAAYIGGYDSASGEATVDGNANLPLQSSTGETFISPVNAAASDGTVEYLTIQNWTSSEQGDILGETQDIGVPSDPVPGWTYEYDNIGPNEYGGWGTNTASGQDAGGGYAIGGGSNTTVEYDCVTHNQQGGVNFAGGDNGPSSNANGSGIPPTTLSGIVVSHDEFSYNGLGNYPDAGSNPYACGCSGGGGKISWSANAQFTDNYIHDNYGGGGIWFDFNNYGANVSNNYIANNWDTGIVYEAGYNLNISDNTIIGNGWASNGAWPATPYCTYNKQGTTLTGQLNNGTTYTSISVAGSSRAFKAGATIGINTGLGPPTDYSSQSYQYVTVSSDTASGATTIPVDSFTANATHPTSTPVQPGLDPNNCTNGYGPAAGFYGGLSGSAMSVNDSSGNSNIAGSNYSGEITITGNNVQNNYTGLNIYWDDARFSGYGDYQCDSPLGGSNTTYYQNWNTARAGPGGTNDGVTTDGSATISSAAGFSRAASDCNEEGPLIPQAGWLVFDGNGAIPSGDTISSCSNDNTCTLTEPATQSTTGDTIYASQLGGCGFADLVGSAPGVELGSPLAYYWDNCAWYSRNISVNNNTFSMSSNLVTDCTAAAACGSNAITTYNEGFTPSDFDIYDGGQLNGGFYSLNNSPISTSIFHNVFSANNYIWTGTAGSGAWRFWAGNSAVSQPTWLNTDHQDAGSTFSSGSALLPSVSITSPSANTENYGTFAVDSTASANDGGSIASVELLVNGAIVQTLTSAPYNFNVNSLTANYHDGTYTIEVLATDDQGNQSSASQSIYIANGDLNLNHSVGIDDLAVMAANWTKTNQTYSQGNITGNGAVGIADLAILASNWGWSEGH